MHGVSHEFILGNFASFFCETQNMEFESVKILVSFWGQKVVDEKLTGIL